MYFTAEVDVRGSGTLCKPQPRPHDVIRAHRHYSTLQADAAYKKRVTWFENVPDSQYVKLGLAPFRPKRSCRQGQITMCAFVH